MKTLDSFMVMLAIPAAFFIGAACTETPEGDLKFEEVGQVSQAVDYCATHDNIRAYYNNFGIPSIAEFETNVWPVLRSTTGGNGQHRCVDAGTTFDLDVLPGQGSGLGYVKVTCDPPGNAYTFSFEIEATETDSTRVRTYTNLSQGALNAFSRVLDLWGQGQFTRVGNGQKGRKPSKPGGRPENPGQPVGVGRLR